MEIYYKNEVAYNKEQINIVELKTKEQANEKLWYLERRKRITATNFARICKKKESTNCGNIVKDILYPNEAIENKAEIIYGKKMEPIGIKRYSDLYKKIIVEKSGFWIDEKNLWIGCSPDRLLLDQTKKNYGVLEIKWVAKEDFKRKKLSEIVSIDKKFCLENIEGSLHLKKKTSVFLSNSGANAYNKKIILRLCHIHRSR